MSGHPDLSNPPCQYASRSGDDNDESAAPPHPALSPTIPVASSQLDLLKNILLIARHSREPVCIACGNDRVCLFNDAFHELLDRRKVSPGESLDRLLGTLWPRVADAVRSAMNGVPAIVPSLPFSLLKNGKQDGILSDFVCIPVKNAGNTVFALYCCVRRTGQGNSPPENTSRPPDNRINDNPLLDNLPVGIMQISVNRDILYSNAAMAEMLGYPPGLIPENLDDLLPHSARNLPENVQFWCNLWHSTSRFSIDLLMKHKNGTYITTANDISLILDAGGKPAYALFVSRTTGKDTTPFSPHISLFDPLTSLPNRNFAQTLIGNAMQHADRSGKELAILLLDINRFKLVNESLGHELGDELLRLVAGRLKSSLRKTDTVIRMGNDEFIVIAEHIRQTDDVRQIAANLLNTLSQTVRLGHHDISISVSMGCSLYPKNASDIDTLLKFADIAKTDAKKAGSNMIRFFSPNMNIMVLDQLLAESRLLRAMDKHEFMMFYQPRLSLKTGRIAGMEALLRWNHPKKGIVSAGKFIRLAEKIGLIQRIGEFVLASVTRQLKVWINQGKTPVPVAINVSSMELRGPKLKESLQYLLQETGLAPQFFEIEITESNLIEDLDRVRQTLTDIRKMGITISIDDFGTGYSSLGYLSSLPADYLKIDSLFIADIVNNRNMASIVETTITLAHSLGMQVIAEGVETAEQLQFLRAKGCDQIQGYYCSRPLSPSGLETFMQRIGEKNTGYIHRE